MNNQNFNDQNKLMENIIKASGGKINQNAVNAAKNGDMSALMQGLSPEDRAKLSAALKDEKSAKQLLSSDAAKKLINMFLNGK